MDTVGDNNLLVSDVTAVFGCYIKYYVKCYSTQTVKPHVYAFEIMLSAQAVMSSVQLPPPLTIRNKRDALYNDVLSLIESMKLLWKADEVHDGTATKVIQTLRDMLWQLATLMAPMQHWLNEVVKC